MGWLDNWITRKVTSILEERAKARRALEIDLLRERVLEMDPAKSYMLVLPTEVDIEEFRQAFAKVVEGKGQNIAVLSADNTKLIEFD